MRDDAVEAVVGARRGDDDHLALGLGQPAVLQHQRVVIGEERPELVRPVGERQKDVGDESRLLLDFQHSRANVVGQVFELGNGIAADGGRSHVNKSISLERTQPRNGSGLPLTSRDRTKSRHIATSPIPVIQRRCRPLEHSQPLTSGTLGVQRLFIHGPRD